MKYPKSKQIIFRRSFPELEKSLIRTSRDIYPTSICDYNASRYSYKFVNGSIIDFGYIATEDSVYNYQSAEYDVIRFDELTHFSEYMYTYMLSRVRGANNYPKQVKSSTNPGNIGHQWVRKRFIDAGRPDTTIEGENGTRRFIPAKVQDNSFLLKSDPKYIQRLENLPEADKKMLLYGSWDVFEGQYFPCWRREIHTERPFVIPKEWTRYFVMDYGLDMLAGYWIALSPEGFAHCYREVHESGLIASVAAERIIDLTDEDVYQYIAPPDMWNRRNDTGRSVAEIFAEKGIHLTKSSNERINGWLDMQEWLRPITIPTEEGESVVSRLRFFDTCLNAISNIPAVMHDKHNPNDVAKDPHELTHAPDAIRYFCAGRPCVEYKQEKKKSTLPFALQDEEKVEGFLW